MSMIVKNMGWENPELRLGKGKEFGFTKGVGILSNV